jgi:hypothetical protein
MKLLKTTKTFHDNIQWTPNTFPSTLQNYQPCAISRGTGLVKQIVKNIVNFQLL